MCIFCNFWCIFHAHILRFYVHIITSPSDHLDSLLRMTSPTILTDLNQLNSIYSGFLLPDAIGDDFDVPNSTISSGQVLSKWLHIPRKDGQPKRLRCALLNEQTGFDWVNNFKEKFLRAISSVSYQILFSVHVSSIVPFEVVNEWTNEKLILAKAKEMGNSWIMKRCKIGETDEIQQQKKDENCNDWNIVTFWLYNVTNCIGPLSPPPEEQEDEAEQSSEKGPSSADNDE